MLKRKGTYDISSNNNKKTNYEKVDSNALWIAVNNENFNLAKRLIKNIADINSIAEDGQYKGVSILWLAVFFDEWDFANLLIEKEADVNATAQDGPYDGASVLWLAVVNKKWNLARLLITKGANINSAAKSHNNKGKSILWMALFFKEISLAKDLISMGADIDATAQEGAEEGISVLWIAAYFKLWDLVNILASKGANVNAIARRGVNKNKSVLYFVTKDQQLSLAKRLINLGANLDIGVAPLENRLILKSLLKFPLNIIEAIVNGEMNNVDEQLFSDINKFFCVISKELILYPVIMQDGFAYNLPHIQQYIKTFSSSLDQTFPSPKSRKQISKEIPEMSAFTANIIADKIESLGNSLLYFYANQRYGTDELRVRQDNTQINENGTCRIKRRFSI